MNRDNSIKDYKERIGRATQYIHNHLGENLDFDCLAGISCYSNYHFHRVMRAYLGEPIGIYILRARLGAAVNLIRLTDLPFNHIKLKKAIMKRISLQPTYKNLPYIKVVYASARGPYNKSAKEAWDKVCSFAGPNGLFSHATQFIGMFIHPILSGTNWLATRLKK